MLVTILIILALFWIAGVVCAVDALLKGRTAQGTIGWLLSLLTIPVIAVPLYILFGRSKFTGYRDSHMSVADATKKYAELARGEVCDCALPDDNDWPLIHCLSALARMPATLGNRVELLIDGEAAFDSMIEGIESAKEYVLAEFYIVRDDEIGERFRKALCDKAREGLPVYLMYDEIGSLGLEDEAIEAYEDAGVKISAFNPTDGKRHRYQLNFRNHRKILVVDGHLAWIGGMNVGDEYLGRNPELGPWRDTHSKLEGPAALGAQLTFCMDWHWAHDETPELDWNARTVEGGDVTALVFPSDPAGKLEGTVLLFLQMIAEARDRLWLSSPYFVPDPGIVAALQVAALRGVDVRIMITETSDHKIADLAAWTFLENLLPAGVRVFRYRGAMMHQKMILVDDRLVAVGSANFDNRSFRLNFEVTLLAAGESIVTQAENMLCDDFEQCIEIEDDELQDKPLRFVLAARLARLASPLL